MKIWKMFFIIILIIIVLFIPTCYASFGSIIDINSKTTITGSWNITITNVKVLSVSPDCNPGDPTFHDTTININASLNKPGDEIVYEITIKNKGTINAKISKINFIEGEGSDAIIYEYTDPKSTLLKGEEDTFTLTIKYDENTEKVPTDDGKTLLGLLEYVQN